MRKLFASALIFPALIFVGCGKECQTTRNNKCGCECTADDGSCFCKDTQTCPAEVVKPHE